MKHGAKAYRVLKIVGDDMNVRTPGISSACCTE